MPQVDMPLEQLRTYRPALTREKGFSAFWAGVVRVARRQPLNVSLTPETYPAKGVRVDAVRYDGFECGRVGGWLLTSEDRGRRPALVVFHGYSGCSPCVFSLLPWVLQGFTVLAIDCRGQNGRSTDAVAYPEGHRPGYMTAGILDRNTYYYRYVYADCVRAIELAASLESVDADRIGVTGVSQGGGLTLAAAALAPDRVKLAAACVPYLCHYRRAVNIAEYPYREIADYLRAWPQRYDRVMATLSYFDNMNLAGRIQAKVLISAGLCDVICPPSTVFAVANRLTCGKEIVVYPCSGHEENDDWRERVFAFMMAGLRPS